MGRKAIKRPTNRAEGAGGSVAAPTPGSELETILQMIRANPKLGEELLVAIPTVINEKLESPTEQTGEAGTESKKGQKIAPTKKLMTSEELNARFFGVSPELKDIDPVAVVRAIRDEWPD